MKTENWTRGPWSVGPRGKTRSRINGPGWFGLAKVVVRMNGSNEDSVQGVANANLIAAAPELYAELKKIDPKNRALAKARGDTHEN
jgi:hypothetical protein